MKETTSTITGELQRLLSICNDGREGYKNAADNAETGELKALFTTYSIQRAEFSDKLRTCIRHLGSNPDNISGGPLGVIHRTWIDIKSALAGRDNHAVLDACITGEKAAVDAYDKVLEKKGMSLEIRQLLMQQRSQINEALQHIQKLEHQYE